MGGRKSGGGGNKQESQPQQQQQQQTQQQPAGPNLAQAQAENARREQERQAAILAEETKRKEMDRYQQVSKLEGEKRRKELEQKAAAEGTKATGGKELAKPTAPGVGGAPGAKPTAPGDAIKDKGRGQAVVSQPALVEGISPESVQGTILGLPKDTKVFTKFGESINRAANLTYSNPQVKVGGM